MRTIQAAHQPTAPEDVAMIDTALDRLTPMLSNLWGRWQDERGHEDIADYAKPLAPLIPPRMTIRRMTKRPFGFEFDIGTSARYAMTATGRSVGWKRI